jgi:hypothetical protein
LLKIITTEAIIINFVQVSIFVNISYKYTSKKILINVQYKFFCILLILYFHCLLLLLYSFVFVIFVIVVLILILLFGTCIVKKGYILKINLIIIKEHENINLIFKNKLPRV